MFSSIYIIDDDPVDQFIAQKVVNSIYAKSGIELFSEANSALAKLHLIANEDPTAFPELILLDINMPLMNGFGFLEKVRLLPPTCIENCMIVMLSSSVNRTDIEKAMTDGIVHTYLVKPLTKQVLDKVLQVKVAKR